jgi:hypothetical protein
MGGGQAGGKGAQAAGPSSGNSSPAGGSQIPASSSGSNDVTVLMEVHHNADFNLVGGVMAIRVKSASLAVTPEYAQYQALPNSGSSGSGGTPPPVTYEPYGSCNGGLQQQAGPTVTPTPSQPSPTTYTAPYYCIQSTQTTNWQVAGMVGLEYFPLHRDYFPRQRGTMFVAKNLVPGIMAASSVTSLGNFFLGLNWEPMNGINFFAGQATANQTTLASGVSQTTVYWPVGSSNGPPTIPTATHLRTGWAIGMGFDLGVFTQLFGKAQSPTLP